MRLVILPEYDTLSKWTANYIAKKIQLHNTKEQRPFILGLPTGSSPLGVYKELNDLYEAGKVSFKNVITFNMDEYVGIPQNHLQSYHTFMWENFFSHIDIPQENVNILNGNAEDPEEECSNYELKIQEVGGIDLFMGGIGADGHIAFNEPGSSLGSKTRIKTLNYDTRLANSRFFDHNVDAVPKFALTVGVKTIMDAREVVIIVNGHQKSRALKKAVEEGVNHMWTISALQLHQKGIIVCDEQATYELKVGTCRYFNDIEKDHQDPKCFWDN